MKRSVVDDIVQPLTTTLGNDKQRVSMAVAVALAYSLRLPDHRLSETPEMFYIGNYMTKVNKFISDFNDRFLLETADMSDSVKAIFAVRYDMLFASDPAKIVAIATGTCPLRDYLARYNMTADVASMVITAGIASMERIERAFAADEQSSADY